jgi:hypothetical protein
MSRVVESTTGAQILPSRFDERAHAAAWHAHGACDADLRRKSTPHADLARRLIVVAQ